MNNRFGEKLKELRIERGLTQQELSKKAGISAVQIKNLEHGYCTPSAFTISKLSTALNADYDILFEYSIKK